MPSRKQKQGPAHSIQDSINGFDDKRGKELYLLEDPERTRRDGREADGRAELQGGFSLHTVSVWFSYHSSVLLTHTHTCSLTKHTHTSPGQWKKNRKKKNVVPKKISVYQRSFHKMRRGVCTLPLPAPRGDVTQVTPMCPSPQGSSTSSFRHRSCFPIYTFVKRSDLLANIKVRLH